MRHSTQVEVNISIKKPRISRGFFMLELFNV